MLTRLSAAFCLAVALAPPPATAADPPGKTLVVRTASFDRLLDQVEVLAAINNQDDGVRQLREFVRSQSTPADGFEGFDTAKPISVFATVTADVADSEVVGFLPVKNKDRVLRMLKDRLDVTPETTASGAYKVHIPLLNEPLFLRFADGYVSVATRSADAAPRTGPVAVPAPSHAVSATLMLDGIPAEVKKVVLGQLELRTADDRRKAEPNETPTQKLVKDLVTDGVLGAVRAVADDVRLVDVRLDVDPTTDDVTVELSATPRDGSLLAVALADAGARTSRPAGLAGGGPAAVRVSYNLPVPAAYRKRVDGVVDAALADVVKQGGDSPAAQRVADTLAPTLKADRFTGAVAVTGPGADGTHRFVAAVGVADGKAIEKLVKDFAAFLPAAVGTFRFDAATAGPFAVHTLDAKAAPAEMKQLFGTRTVRLATSADALVVAVGADDSTKALEAKPAPAPFLVAEVAMARLIPLTERGLKADERKAVLHDAFGDGPTDGKDTIRIAVEGGTKLTARLSAKGKALRAATAVDQLKKK